MRFIQRFVGGPSLAAILISGEQSAAMPRRSAIARAYRVADEPSTGSAGLSADPQVCPRLSLPCQAKRNGRTPVLAEFSATIELIFHLSITRDLRILTQSDLEIATHDIANELDLSPTQMRGRMRQIGVSRAIRDRAASNLLSSFFHRAHRALLIEESIDSYVVRKTRRREANRRNADLAKVATSNSCA